MTRVPLVEMKGCGESFPESKPTPGPWTAPPSHSSGSEHALSVMPIRRGPVLCCLSEGYHAHLLLSEIRGLREEAPTKTMAIIAGGEVEITASFSALAELWAEYLEDRNDSPRGRSKNGALRHLATNARLWLVRAIGA